MNWMVGTVVALALGGAGFVVVRVIHGRASGFTPLGAFIAAWTLAIFLYVANPLRLYRLGGFGSLVIALGIGSYVAAYAPILIAMRNRSGAAGERGSVRHRMQISIMTSFWNWCRRLWVPLFIVFLFQIRAYSASGIIAVLGDLRADLSTGSPPFGFYFFYFAQMSVPLGAVLYLETRRRRYIWWTGAATLALIFTSARTNILVALASVVFVVILWGRVRVTLRRVAVVLLGLIAALWIFNFVGNGVGKTYQNSRLYATIGYSTPVPEFLMQPLFYVSGPLPYLGDVVRTTPETGIDHGANTFRPFVQIAAIVLPVKPAPNNQEFRSIPFPTNIGTYMTRLYRDFGVIGVVVGSALLGALSAAAWAAWWKRSSPLSLAVVSLVLVFSVLSILSDQYTQLWFVLFLVLVGFASRTARVRAAETENRPDQPQRGVTSRLALRKSDN